MRHPTWFYIVLTACALLLTGAGLEFVRVYKAHARYVVLEGGVALDTRSGEACLYAINVSEDKRCFAFKGFPAPR